jgi:type VI secretion system protein ImpG
MLHSSVTHTLIELLANNCIQIIARDLTAPSKKTVQLPPECIRQVGFGMDEGMTPFPRRSFWPYRLLQEYFTFPEKFLFLDVTGLERLAAAGFGQQVELIFLIWSRNDLNTEWSRMPAANRHTTYSQLTKLRE